MQQKSGLWLVAAALLLGVAAALIALYAGPALLARLIVNNVVLSEDSEALERWKVTPQPLNYYTYIFHVNNPDEVARGAKPIVTEKGPYVYDLFKERVDVKFHPEDDTVSYFDKTIYRFNKEKSGCHSENDVVTILNAPVLGTGLMLEKMMAMALPIFNDALPLMFAGVTNAFVTAKVREVLFEGVFVNCSYPTTQFPVGPVCDGMRSRAPVTFRREGANFYFSMFNHLNGTDVKRRVRVSRGQRDPSSLGRIVQFGDGSLLHAWRPNTHCNMINGTDTTIFKPFIQPPERIPVFVSGSCRSMYVTYERPVYKSGILGLHYIADPNMLASGRDYPPNRCFCALPEAEESSSSTEAAFSSSEASPNETASSAAPEEEAGSERRRKREARMEESNERRDASTCLPKGALDMTNCFGSPVILTLPHFYLGAAEFSEYVTGVKAIKEKHETFVDIEPLTGIPVRGGKRVQLNMFLKKIEQIDVLSSVSEGLFPILWVDEGIDLEGRSLEQLAAAHRRIKLLRASPWLLLGVSAVLAAVGVLLHAHSRGLFARVASSVAEQRRARAAAAQGEYPATGPPPGNYGYALGFGPATNHKAGLIGVGGVGGALLLGGGGGGFGGGGGVGGLHGLHSLKGLSMEALADNGPVGSFKPQSIVRTFCNDSHPNSMRG